MGAPATPRTVEQFFHCQRLPPFRMFKRELSRSRRCLFLCRKTGTTAHGNGAFPSQALKTRTNPTVYIYTTLSPEVPWRRLSTEPAYNYTHQPSISMNDKQLPKRSATMGACAPPEDDAEDLFPHDATPEGDDKKRGRGLSTQQIRDQPSAGWGGT